jgi:multiple sugar transport system substrate-binding protein
VTGTRDRARVGFLAAASLAAAFLVGCTPNAGSNISADDVPDSHDITVWITDTLPERVAGMQTIIADFTTATGLTAELVSVPEHQFHQTLTSSAASGNLPDVIGQARPSSGTAAASIDCAAKRLPCWLG